MHEKSSELRRLITVLNSIGKVKDYPTVREEANWLNYYASSMEPSPAEKQKGIVEHLEQLPSLLKELKDRARREDKKETYERFIATVEHGFPTLLDLWRHWNKSKEEIYSIAHDVIEWERTARTWRIKPQANSRPILFFSSISDEPDESTAAGRFEARVQELLPKPRITLEDYEMLIYELEIALAEWREVAMAPENRERMDEILVQAEVRITELHVLSLLDF